MPVLNTDARTQRVVDLLTKLATPHEPFLQPWEYEKWLAEQEEVFYQLYTRHQHNHRVVSLLREVDGGSRNDARWSDPVRRAIPLADHYLGLVLEDIEEQNTCPRMPEIGDPVFDSWAKDRQVAHGTWGTEAKRQTVREQNRNMKYEVGSDGYVRERPRKQ